MLKQRLSVNTFLQKTLPSRLASTRFTMLTILKDSSMTPAFLFSRLPHIEFGHGALLKATPHLARYGKNILLITGAHSFADSPQIIAWLNDLSEKDFHIHQIKVRHEPSPSLIDETVRQFATTQIDVVVGLGGGSALDAAKAIAGLLKPGNSVRDHLEGVGPELPYRGPTTPFIAIPTTAGTGSEATKNAVLSEGGARGFKKSFRDDQLVAEWAIIDPDLLATCPPAIIAANGMDALTQLLESYVSTRANSLTDALALDGLTKVRDSLLPWFSGTSLSPAEHRADIAYAALLSGITLAQVGLGSVHGLAAPLGAYFPIPHGIACGTLVAEATRMNIHALKQRTPKDLALQKYAGIGRLLARDNGLEEDAAHNALINMLEQWTAIMKLPRLSHFGVTEIDIPRLVANSRGSSMKTNPIVLTDAEIAALISARL